MKQRKVVKGERNGKEKKKLELKDERTTTGLKLRLKKGMVETERRKMQLK